MPGKVNLPAGVMAPIAERPVDAPQWLIDKSAVGGGRQRGGRGLAGVGWAVVCRAGATSKRVWRSGFTVPILAPLLILICTLDLAAAWEAARHSLHSKCRINSSFFSFYSSAKRGLQWQLYVKKEQIESWDDGYSIWQKNCLRHSHFFSQWLWDPHHILTKLIYLLESVSQPRNVRDAEFYDCPLPRINLLEVKWKWEHLTGYSIHLIVFFLTLNMSLFLLLIVLCRY